MRTEAHVKQFDCVGYMREARDRISAEIAGMNHDDPDALGAFVPPLRSAACRLGHPSERVGGRAAGRRFALNMPPARERPRGQASSTCRHSCDRVEFSRGTVGISLSSLQVGSAEGVIRRPTSTSRKRMRTLEEIRADILALGNETEGLLDEIPRHGGSGLMADDPEALSRPGGAQRRG